MALCTHNHDVPIVCMVNCIHNKSLECLYSRLSLAMFASWLSLAGKAWGPFVPNRQQDEVTWNSGWSEWRGSQVLNDSCQGRRSCSGRGGHGRPTFWAIFFLQPAGN